MSFISKVQFWEWGFVQNCRLRWVTLNFSCNLVSSGFIPLIGFAANFDTEPLRWEETSWEHPIQFPCSASLPFSVAVITSYPLLQALWVHHPYPSLLSLLLLQMFVTESQSTPLAPNRSWSSLEPFLRARREWPCNRLIPAVPCIKAGSTNRIWWRNHCTISQSVWKGWRQCEAREALSAELKPGGQQGLWELKSSWHAAQGSKGLSSLAGWAAGQQLPQGRGAGGQRQTGCRGSVPTLMGAAPQHPRQPREALITDWWTPAENRVTIQGHGQGRRSK